MPVGSRVSFSLGVLTNFAWSSVFDAAVNDHGLRRAHSAGFSAGVSSVAGTVRASCGLGGGCSGLSVV